MPEPRFRLPGDPGRLSAGNRDRLAGQLAGARALLGRVRDLHPPELTKQTIKIDKLDAVYFSGIAAEWPRLAQLGQEGSKRYSCFPDLLTDIFFGLFHWQPQLRTREQLLPSHRGNWDLLTQAMRLATWGLAREKSRINEGQSMIGLVRVARELLKAVPPEALAAAGEAAEQEETLDDLDQQLDDLIEQLAQTLGDGEQDPSDEAGDGAGDQSEGDGDPGANAPGGGQAGAGPGPGEGASPDPGPPGQADGDGEPGEDPGEGAGAVREAPAGEGDGDGTGGEGGADGPTDDETQAMLDAIDEALAEAGVQLEAIAGNPAPEPRVPPDLARNAARQGLEEADGEMEALASALAGFGSDSEELNQLPIADRMAIAEKLTEQEPMRELADEIGRQRHLALDAARQPGAIEPRELVGVRIGGQVSAAMPGELALLAEPRLRNAFYYKLGLQALLLREYAGDAPAGRGPAIVLLDSSGSMLGPGDRWSKGFVLGMLEICSLQDRDLVVIWFDYELHPPPMLFPKGRAGLAEKVALAQRFHGGGTNFRPALEAAIDNVEDAAGDWATADIVMVTDGISDLDEVFVAEYNRRCQAIGVRTHGILVDVSAHYVRTLEAFCDQAWAVSTAAGNRPDPGPMFRAVALKGKPAPRPQR